MYVGLLNLNEYSLVRIKSKVEKYKIHFQLGLFKDN